MNRFKYLLQVEVIGRCTSIGFRARRSLLQYGNAKRAGRISLLPAGRFAGAVKSSDNYLIRTSDSNTDNLEHCRSILTIASSIEANVPFQSCG